MPYFPQHPRKNLNLLSLCIALYYLYLYTCFVPLSLSHIFSNGWWLFHTMSFTGGSQHHSPAVPRLRLRRRKPKNSNRFRLLGPPPTTPHSSWKFEDNKNDLVFNYHHHHTKLVSELFQRGRVQASARKLAAGLWRLLGAPHCQLVTFLIFAITVFSMGEYCLLNK